MPSSNALNDSASCRENSLGADPDLQHASCPDIVSELANLSERLGRAPAEVAPLPRAPFNVLLLCAPVLYWWAGLCTVRATLPDLIYWLGL
jgi:hypothetical protein